MFKKKIVYIYIHISLVVVGFVEYYSFYKEFLLVFLLICLQNGYFLNQK